MICHHVVFVFSICEFHLLSDFSFLFSLGGLSQYHNVFVSTVFVACCSLSFFGFLVDFIMNPQNFKIFLNISLNPTFNFQFMVYPKIIIIFITRGGFRFFVEKNKFQHLVNRAYSRGGSRRVKISIGEQYSQSNTLHIQVKAIKMLSCVQKQ